MTYQVIARRWRPKNFSEIIGQDSVVKILSNAIKNNRIAHSYLFTGPRGTGKTTAARLFSIALNCENGPSIEWDENSQISQSITKGSCLDVIEIDGASNNSVDQVRSLREECPYAPTQCPYKIYIIDEVHMLSTAAFNALLKTLEEPPSHVKFILATTELNKIPQTILSRCQCIEFHLIDEHLIVNHLKTIVEKDGFSATKNALEMIARLSGGSLRDAQSILEQLIIFCDGSLTEEDITSIYGIPPKEFLENLANSILENDYSGVLKFCNLCVSNNYHIYKTLVELQTLFYRLLTQEIISLEKIQEEKIPETKHKIDLLRRIFEVLQTGITSVKFGLSERINFETTLLKATEQVNSRSLDSLIQEFEKLSPEVLEKKNVINKSIDISRNSTELSKIQNKSTELSENKKITTELAPKEKIETKLANVTYKTTLISENFNETTDFEKIHNNITNLANVTNDTKELAQKITNSTDLSISNHKSTELSKQNFCETNLANIYQNKTILSNQIDEPKEEAEEYSDHLENSQIPFLKSAQPIEDLIFVKEEMSDDFFEREQNLQKEDVCLTFAKNDSEEEPLESIDPPPNFQDVIKTIPEDIKTSFSDLFRGEFTGIWPINKENLI